MAETPPHTRLADHIEKSVDEVVEFHLEHYRAASGLQKMIDSGTELLSRPAMLLFFLAAILIWAVGNLVVGPGRAFDPPPFVGLELSVSIAALLVVLLILVTQRREDQLAERRAQLTLELALLGDRKSAKIIALLEELRRDHPGVADRVDAESEEMATPADPASVLAAIDERAGEGPGA